MEWRFHRPVYLRINFPANFEYEILLTNQKAKTGGYEIVCCFDNIYSSFFHYRTMDAHIHETVLPFWREKVLQIDAKNKLICGSAVAWTKYGSCTLRLSGLLIKLILKQSKIIKLSPLQAVLAHVTKLNSS